MNISKLTPDELFVHYDADRRSDDCGPLHPSRLEAEAEMRRRITPQPVGDHPEDNCKKCGHRMRFNYAADSSLWNKVVGAVWSIICIDCFIELCQAADVEPKFVVFHIPGSEFHHEVTPPTMTGPIGELLDEQEAAAYAAGQYWDDNPDDAKTIAANNRSDEACYALRLVVSKMQAELDEAWKERGDWMLAIQDLARLDGFDTACTMKALEFVQNFMKTALEYFKESQADLAEGRNPRKIVELVESAYELEKGEHPILDEFARWFNENRLSDFIDEIVGRANNTVDESGDYIPDMTVFVSEFIAEFNKRATIDWIENADKLPKFKCSGCDDDKQEKEGS